jgi:hypothetical protein
VTAGAEPNSAPLLVAAKLIDRIVERRIVEGPLTRGRVDRF